MAAILGSTTSVFFNLEFGVIVESECSTFPVILGRGGVRILFTIEVGDGFSIGISNGLRHCARFSSDSSRE